MYDPRSNQLLEEILSRNDRMNRMDKAFKQRLIEGFPDVFHHLHILYPLRDDLWDHLEDLVEVMIKNHEQRQPDLKALDKQRLADPHWFVNEQIVGMMLYVDRFADDLKTFKKKVPYLEELGVNLVHLMPILKCPEDHNDGGYAVSDYREINPAIGTMKDVNELAADFRKKDMYLMMDLVLNHTSDEHEWAIKARQGDPKYQDYYYFYSDRHIPDQFEESLPQVFPDMAPGNFTHIPELDKWVMTVFNNFQWDLNYTNPRVFIEMLDVILYLGNQGIDILRLDALAFMWKKIGTTSQNLDEAHRIIKALKACSRITAPGVLFLAEAIVTPPEIIKYFGEVDTTSNECDIAYNATLMTLLWDSMATKNNRLLWTSLHNVPRKPRGTTWLNYIRCHDDIGLGYEDHHAEWAGYNPSDHRRFLVEFLTGNIEWSFARGKKFMENKHNGDARISGSLASLAGLEKALEQGDSVAVHLAIKRILLLHSVMLSFGGIPLFYAGDELAYLNDYSFENDPKKRYDNRWMHRPKMDWEKAKLRKKKGTIEQQVFSALKNMVTLRKQIPEFADTDNCHLVDCHNQHLLAYVRTFEAHKTFVVCNLNDHPESLSLDMMFYMGFDMKNKIFDQYSGEKVVFENYQFILKPYQFVWLTEKAHEK